MPISRSERSKSANITSKNRWPRRAELAAVRAFEPVQIKESVQADQLKPAVDRVGHAAIGEETGLARLLDHPPIGELGGDAAQDWV